MNTQPSHPGETASLKITEVANDVIGKAIIKAYRRMAKQVGGCTIVLHGRKAKSPTYYKYRGDNTNVNLGSAQRIAIYVKAHPDVLQEKLRLIIGAGA